jgi:hypothetical protein
MERAKQVPMMLSVPKAIRDRLRTLAAEENLKNPDQVTSASTLAREILIQYMTDMFPHGKIGEKDLFKNQQQSDHLVK